MKLIESILVMVPVLFILIGCNVNKPDLTIAVASNMQFVMEDVVANFELETGIEVEMVTGSSGKLLAQITNGAPYDIFLTANVMHSNVLFEKNISIGYAQHIALGKLIVWSSLPLNSDLNSLLKSNKVKHIALANPKLAPFGEAARLFLEYNSLDSVLKPKLVFAESVAQVNQFVTTKSVEIGFTSLSSALKHQDNDFYWMELKGRDQYLIEQVAVQLKQSDNLQLAERFIGYLTSEQVKSTFEKHGYWVGN